MLVTCQRFCFFYYLGWSGSILQFRQNIIKVGLKSWLLTCSNNITLSLPSYNGSALKRELDFCNGYLSLLYFWLEERSREEKGEALCVAAAEYKVDFHERLIVAQY